MITSSEFHITTDISGTRVRLEMSIEQGGKPETVGLVVDAHDLDTIIDNLGKARARLQPAHPRNLDPKPVFTNVTRGTVMHIDRPHNVSREIFLAVLHPGFGWLAFPMENKTAVRVGAMLAQQGLEASGQAIVGLDGKPL